MSESSQIAEVLEFVDSLPAGVNPYMAVAGLVENQLQVSERRSSACAINENLSSTKLIWLSTFFFSFDPTASSYTHMGFVDPSSHPFCFCDVIQI